MADYGRKLEFGVSVEPLADPPDWAARIAKAADEAGLDLLGIQDHPYQRRFLDTPKEDPVRQVELFAAEVVPAVRESVEKERT